jgi:HK97 family phage prohead protease
VERRYSTDCRAELAAGGRLIGHASVFNEETRIGEFFEVIDPAAFDDVLDGDTVLQIDHAGLPLARTPDTLKLATDSRGLAIDGDPADTTAGRDLRILVDRGDLRAMSFGFTVAADAWEKRADGSHLRRVLKIGRLFDVSVVTFPAYPGTDVSLRSAFGDIPRPPHSPRATPRGQAALIRAKLRKEARP